MYKSVFSPLVVFFSFLIHVKSGKYYKLPGGKAIKLIFLCADISDLAQLGKYTNICVEVNQKQQNKGR